MTNGFDQACQMVGLRANPTKMSIALGRGVNVSDIPNGYTIDPRALVLKHGGLTPLPAAPASTVNPGSQLQSNSPEVAAIKASREKFFGRLQKLRAGGLPALEC